MGRAKPRRQPDALDLPQGSLLPPPVRPRAGRLTPEQLAKASVAKRPSPPGKPDLAELTLRLALRRDALERLTARAITEERKVEALVAEILEQAARRERLR